MSDTANQATESAPEKRPLRVLVVEDSEFDARMLVGLLKAGGFEPEFRRVETAPQMSAALASVDWEIILADYNMPEFSAPKALELLQETKLDIPFIIISGGIGEDTAVAAMKAAAFIAATAVSSPMPPDMMMNGISSLVSCSSSSAFGALNSGML